MEVIDDGRCGAVGGNGVVLVAVVVLFLWLECSSTVSALGLCSAVQCLLLLLALPEMG